MFFLILKLDFFSAFGLAQGQRASSGYSAPSSDGGIFQVTMGTDSTS